MRLPSNSIRTSRLVPLAVALLITACAGFEPFEHRDEREEGPRAGLISGEAGEFVILRRSSETEGDEKADK